MFVCNVCCFFFRLRNELKIEFYHGDGEMWCKSRINDVWWLVALTYIIVLNERVLYNVKGVPDVAVILIRLYNVHMTGMASCSCCSIE